MSSMWPSGFERSSTLQLATIGRKTGRRHEVTIWFVTSYGQIYVSTVNNRRDWVRNLMKNPSCEVKLSKATHKMTAVVIQSADERESVKQLYRRKYPITSRLMRLPRRESVIYEFRHSV